MGNQHSLVQQSPAKSSYLQIQVDHTESDKITAATFFFCPCKRPFPSSSESVQQTRVDQSGIAREYQMIRWSERILDDPSLDRTVLSAASPQWLHKNRLCRWSSAGQKRSMIPSRSFMSESVTQMLTKKDPNDRATVSPLTRFSSVCGLAASGETRLRRCYNIA